MEAESLPTVKKKQQTLCWYHCRLRTLFALSILIVVIVGVRMAHRCYEDGIVTHLESLGAGVMLKASGYSRVGASSVKDVPSFLKETCGDLRYLAQYGDLDLDLSGTNVSDAELQQLAAIAPLFPDLRNTKITDEGVKKLRQALPNCQIER